MVYRCRSIVRSERKNHLVSHLSGSLRATLISFAIAAVILGALAVLTIVGAGKIEQAHPPSGRFVEVDGGRLHLVELGAADAPPVVLLHGAGVNLGDMRLALGDRLAAKYRVILIDRPGHGWSDRPGGSADASPSRQAALIHQALMRIGVTRAILVAHSWSGALATAYALDYPQGVAGLVLLAPVTHPWPLSVAWSSNLFTALSVQAARSATAPLIGPLVARTLALPLGEVLIGLGARSAFAPQPPPLDYLARTGAELMLRPSEFTANAEDLAQLRESLVALSPRYPAIKAPVTILTGDLDEIVPPEVHAKAMATILPGAKLVVLPGIGHMLHFAAPERIVEAIAEIGQGDAGARPAEKDSAR
jgi:pimeloyl-ACP methyl ester carboxylesterase